MICDGIGRPSDLADTSSVIAEAGCGRVQSCPHPEQCPHVAALQSPEPPAGETGDRGPPAVDTLRKQQV